MGVRGELFSTKVALDNRTYFFNVKENRNGDVFMTIVESKPNEGEGFDRHQVVLFADDTQAFLKGLDASLQFVEKEVMQRRKAARDRRSAAPASPRPETGRDIAKKVLRKKAERTAGGKPGFGKKDGRKPPRPAAKPRARVRAVKPSPSKED